MNYLLFIGSFLLGILIKLYDEIVDNNLISIYNLLIQISIVLLSLYIFKQNILFMVYALILFCFDYICDYIYINNKIIDITQIAMNNIFWYFYTILLLFLFFMYHKNIHINFNTKTYTYILVVSFSVIILFIEAYLFSEESSNIKILIRIIYFFVYIFTTLFTIYFKSYFYITVPLTQLFWVGYLLTFIIFKQYIIPNSSINIIGTLTYIWKKLKSKKLQQKLKEKKGRKRSQQIKTIF
jgi:hypothetical protein